MPAKPWFPTYVYEAPLQRQSPRTRQRGGGGDPFARVLLEACAKVRDADDEGRLWCREGYPGGYTSYQTLRALHRVDPAFAALERKIWRHVVRFTNRLDMDLREAQLAMVDCWVNFMSRDAAHPMHTHPDAVVSGTFYVKTPPGCAAIRFEDPRLANFACTPPRRADSRPENRRQIGYAVAAGNLILFESWLRHGVETNPTLDERVSVSFNYAWV